MNENSLAQNQNSMTGQFWSLTSLQQRLVKTGGRLLKHARYYWLLLAENHLTRRLFGAMVGGSARCPCQHGR